MATVAVTVVVVMMMVVTAASLAHPRSRAATATDPSCLPMAAV